MLTGLAMLLGLGSTAFVISALCLVAFVTSIGMAWKDYGREVLPLRAVTSLPGYIVGKMGIYQQAIRGKVTAHWVGTDRARNRNSGSLGVPDHQPAAGTCTGRDDRALSVSCSRAHPLARVRSNRSSRDCSRFKGKRKFIQTAKHKT